MWINVTLLWPLWLYYGSCFADISMESFMKVKSDCLPVPFCQKIWTWHKGRAAKCVIIDAVAVNMTERDFAKFAVFVENMRFFAQKIILVDGKRGLKKPFAVDIYQSFDGERIAARKCAFAVGKFVPVFDADRDLCDGHPFYEETPIQVAAFELREYITDDAKIKANWGSLFARRYEEDEHRFHGIDVELLRILGGKFNFAEEITIARKTFRQILVMTRMKKKHLAISHTSIGYRMNTIQNVIGPIFPREFFIIAPVPKTRLNFWTMLYPFDSDTWICYWVTTVVITLFLMIAKRLLDCENDYQAITIGFLTALDETLPQFYFDKRGHNTQVLIYSTWFVGATVLNMAYKSTLRANLITIQYENMVLTAEDLSASRLPVDIPNNTLIHTQLRDHPWESYRAVWERNELVFSRYSYEINGGVCTPVAGRATFGDRDCMVGFEDKFTLGNERMGGTYTAWVVKKDSPLSEPLNLEVMRLTDAGIPTQLLMLHREMHSKPKGTLNSLKEFRDDEAPIILEQIKPMLIIIFPLGIIPSILRFFYERVTK